MSHILIRWAVIVLLSTMCGVAEARALHVRQSDPVAETILHGPNAQFVIRFDRWVDHATSRLDVTANGRVVEALVPTGDSEPDVLAATAPMLPPGQYLPHGTHDRSPTVTSQRAFLHGCVVTFSPSYS